MLDRRGARRTGRATGAARPRGRLRRRVPRARAPGREGAGRAARRRTDHDRRQRRHHPDQARRLGAPPRGRRPPAHRGRLRGRRRHLPRPRHDPAGRPAAAHPGPPVEPAAGGRADDRRRRGRGRTVSLGSVLGPAFASDRTMFSVDEFHPSALATPRPPPSCCRRSPTPSASGPPRPTAACGTIRRDTVRPVARAAARAARRPGTEVQPTEVRGSGTGPRGPWALLRRRRPPEIPTPDEAEEAAEEPVAG